MKVETERLKETLELLTSIIKNDNLKPVTSFIQLCAKDNKLYLGMTDNMTRIAYSIDCSDELPTIVLDVNKLIKLVKLTTKDSIAIEYKDEVVTIKGNGRYKEAVQCDESGSMLKLNISFPKCDGITGTEVDLSECAKAYKRNKLGLFNGDDHAELFRYYSNGDRIITSDSNVIAITRGNLFDTELYPITVAQLVKFNKVYLYKLDNLYYITDNTLHYSTPKLRESLFPYEQIEPFLTIQETLEWAGEFDKSEFLKAVKRLDIFSDNIFDIPSVIIYCNDGKVWVKDAKDKAEEEIGTCSELLSMSIKLPIERIIKILSVMESRIAIFASNELAILEDSVGMYIISCIEEE